MQYPMYVDCPKCGEAVTVAEPVVRCRCRKCNAFFLLSSAVEPEVTEKTSPSRPVDAGKQIRNKPKTSVDPGYQPARGARGTRRQKPWAAILVGLCGVLLIGCLCVYLVKPNGQ